MQPGSPAGETREQVTDLTLLPLLLASTHSPGFSLAKPNRKPQGKRAIDWSTQLSSPSEGRVEEVEKGGHPHWKGITHPAERLPFCAKSFRAPRKGTFWNIHLDVQNTNISDPWEPRPCRVWLCSILHCHWNWRTVLMSAHRWLKITITFWHTTWKEPQHVSSMQQGPFPPICWSVWTGARCRHERKHNWCRNLSL